MITASNLHLFKPARQVLYHRPGPSILSFKDLLIYSVCVCVRERERETERALTGRDLATHAKTECHAVCLCSQVDDFAVAAAFTMLLVCL